MPRCLSPRLPAASLALLLALGCAPGTGHGEDEGLMVYAAASLRDVMLELGSAWAARGGAPAAFNFAGSNTLARQIEAAGRADLFFSADRQWIEALERGGRLAPGSARRVLGNSLVVIGRRDGPHRPSSLEDLARLPYRHLALAEPEAVPAGRYARAALAAVPWRGDDLWQAVELKVAPALDVRAALALVESDPEVLGIVYRTDALASREVEVLLELAPAPGREIAYWGALVAAGPRAEEAAAFLAFLTGEEAAAIARRHGFRDAAPVLAAAAPERP